MPSSPSLNSRAPYPPIDVKAALQRARDASTVTDEKGKKILDPARLFTLATTLTEQFNTNGLLECINMAIALFQEGLSLLPPGHVNQGPALDGFGTALRKRFGRLGRREDIDDSIECNRQALDLCDTDDPDRLVSLGNLGFALVDRFSRWGNIADLDEALVLHEEALAAAPFAHPVRVIFLTNLEHALKAKYGLDGQLKDLERIILLDREALRLTPVQYNARRAFIISNLATAVHMLFERTGQENDLHEAVSLARESLKLTPPRHPERDVSTFNLANVLLAQYQRNCDSEVLDEAILLHEEALRLRQPPHPQRSGSLNSLAFSLKLRFTITNRVKDLEHSISSCKEASTLTPMTHPGRLLILDNYADSLIMRYEHLGEANDLDRALFLLREALKGYKEFHPSRCNSLLNLSYALLTKFYLMMDAVYLEESLVHAEAALELCGGGHPLRPSALTATGRILSVKFRSTGNLKDLNTSEFNLRESLELLPASAPGRGLCAHNLAIALSLQYHETSKLECLEEAVSLSREVVEFKLTQRQTATLESSMSGLAVVLNTRFRRTRQKEDLEEAIFLYREALPLLSPNHTRRPDLLDNLAVALKLHFDTFRESTAYLIEAISLYKEALSLTPHPHIHRSRGLNNLAMALGAKFDIISMDRQDLDEAIALSREAMFLCPAPHPLRFHILHNLGYLLYDKIIKFLSISNLLELLEESISLHEDALSLLPHSHPETAQVRVSLAQSILHFFHHSNDPCALELGVCIFRLAATCLTAPLFVRFKAAKRWAELVDIKYPSALEAYRLAISLLSQITALDLGVYSRQDILNSGVEGLARNAAACAVHSGDLELAVELLEEGRAIFWSQSLPLRSPINRLIERVPELAHRFREVSLSLEEGSYQHIIYLPGNDADKVLKEREIARLRVLHDERQSLVQEIQSIEGFQEFFQPRKFSVLQEAATENAIVILIPTTSCTDILVLTSTSIEHIPVPDLGQIAVDELISYTRIASNANGRKPTDGGSTTIGESTLALDAFHGIVSGEDFDSRAERVFKDRNMDGDDIFTLVLGVVWCKIISPIIQVLHLKESDTPPTLHFLPSGPLTFIPIHAAGLYSATPPIALSDFLIPTYIPTISSILSVPLCTPTPSNDNVLAIVQPLPNAATELRKLKLHIPLSNLTVLSPAPISSVLTLLPDVNIIHFICHAQRVEMHSPTNMLQLDDGNLTMAEVFAAPNVRRKKLAFICTRNTIVEGSAPSDEVIDLGVSLLFAGFNGVVRTMWTMANMDGANITDTFYKNYSSGKRPGIPLSFSGGPRALHLAMKRLRDENVPFVRWVPFTYVGN